jgi:regulation of enolase protein 1 (concanavalin A-like superfamily)
MRHRSGLLVVVVGLLALPSIWAADKPESIPGWGELTNPDADCKVKLEKERLTVKVPGAAHDFAGELMRWNAPRVMSRVEGDFIVEVQVSGKFTPAAESTIKNRLSYNGGGILLVQDKDNHLSLQRGAVNLGDRVRHYANFELRRGAELVISLSENELEDKPVFLRVERRGNKVYGLSSHDGVNWKAYDPIEVGFPKAIDVGVVGINSSADPFECEFEGLSLFRKGEIKPGGR